MIAHSRHRKYANAKEYTAFRNGVAVGIFPVEWKMSEEELKSFLLDVKSVTKADEIRLTWTALKGWVNEKVEI